MAFLNQISTILEMGNIYALVSLGVYITYKILNIADLSVDGTFPLGGVVFAVLLTAGCPWTIAMIASFLAGCVAGLVTGILHVKLKINGLLSGIITLTALLSVTYLIANGPMVSFAKNVTLLNNPVINGLHSTVRNYAQVLLTFLLVVATKIILDLFMKTRLGFMLRATGDNPQIVTQMGRNTDNYKMLGLAVANGLVALAGSLYCQYNTVFNSSMGSGTVVIALACVIIGCVISKRVKIMSDTTGVIIGGIIYYAVLSVAMTVLGSDYTKLVVAILFVLILLLDNGAVRNRFKSHLKSKKGY